MGFLLSVGILSATEDTEDTERKPRAVAADICDANGNRPVNVRLPSGVILSESRPSQKLC